MRIQLFASALLLLVAVSSANPFAFYPDFRALRRGEEVSRIFQEGTDTSGVPPEDLIAATGGPVDSNQGSNESGNSNITAHDVAAAVSLQRLVVNISNPVAMVYATPPGQSREFLFVAQQTGQLLVVDTSTAFNLTNTTDDMNLEPYLILDVADDLVTLQEGYDERGLLGVAFHKEFATNGRFFIIYSSRTPAHPGALEPGSSRACGAFSGPAGTCNLTAIDHVMRLAEYKMTAFEIPTDNSSSSSSTSNSSQFEKVGSVEFVRTILALEEPFSNHNGDNSLMVNSFDGMLYVGLGDGGCEYDPFEIALNKDSVFGKILRIDIDAIASRNDSCVEPLSTFSKLGRSCSSLAQSVSVFAFGIRNPSGIDFVSNNDTAQNWAAVVTDVGTVAYEEINYMVTPGAFYGYSFREGYACLNRTLVDQCSNETSLNASDPSQSFQADTSVAVEPITVLSHDDPSVLFPSAIIGGRLYQGKIQALRNKYVFTILGSEKSHKFLGNANLFYIDLNSLHSTHKGLYNRTVDDSVCTSSNATFDIAPGQSKADLEADRIKLDSAKSPSGLPIYSISIQYVWDILQSHFASSTAVNSDRTELLWGLQETISPVDRDGAIYRVVPVPKSTLGKPLA